MNASTSTSTTKTRMEKVRSIFDRFDGNGDGGLDRAEMSQLIEAVNPNVKFSPEQTSAILDEIFRTYADFIADPDVGLSFAGLLRTYDDGAGDVDRDFAALGFQASPPASSSPRSLSPSRSFSDNDLPPHVQQNYRPSPRISPAWASTPNHGIDYDDTWKVIEDLEILIRKKIKACNFKKKVKDSNFGDGCSDLSWSTELSFNSDNKKVAFDTNSGEFRSFMKELKVIRARVDRASRREEAFDGHMAIGRTLFDYQLFEEALESFKRATELKPTDVRVNFRMGNSSCSLGKLKDAKESYLSALESAEADVNRWSSLLPQIHVNLGFVLEGEGMLLCASEHYREAAILCPTHYRALKLLGSALFGVGEYRAAEKALEEAVFLKPDFADAHCDLGSVLHAMGEEERAILAFQKAIDLKPDHLDALYNLGGLLMNMDRHKRAAEIYARVLAVRPNHWRAQLNRGIALLGARETEEAKRCLRDAFKMTQRVELYDAIGHMKRLTKKSKIRLSSIISMHMEGRSRKDLLDAVDAIVVDSSKFKLAKEGGTSRKLLAVALEIRNLQRSSRLCLCDVSLLKKEMAQTEVSMTYAGGGLPEISVRKAAWEVILRRLLPSLKPETFQGAVKAIDEKVLVALDATSSGRVDLGMFYAIIAPICAGQPEKRKRAAFDALNWRSMKGVQGEIGRGDVSIYLKYLRAIYFPSERMNSLIEVGVEEDDNMISFPEFVEMFDDVNSGFSILNTLLKLEDGDRIRHGGHCCDVCRYPIAGPRFKETTSRFNLCATCYSAGMVPASFKKEQYTFKEYWI
ncbi:hypothetical protein ACLOJK_033184 [Asimina triloba]